MASSFVTVPKSLLLKPNLNLNSNPNPPSLSSRPLIGLRRNSFRITTVSKIWEPSKVVPQADRVLIRLQELPQKSAGGVLLPKSAVKFERHLMGEILSTGAEVEGNGIIAPGKKVLFSDMNAYEVDLGTDARHCFCKAGDLLAVVE